MENLRLRLRPSRLLAGLLALLHGFALFSVLASLEGWPAIIACLGVTLSAFCAVGDAMQRWPRSAFELELRADDSARWRDGAGSWHAGRLLRSRHVSAVLVTLVVSGAVRRRKWFVVLPDSAATEDIRKLRVWLRWRANGREKNNHAAE